MLALVADTVSRAQLIEVMRTNQLAGEDELRMIQYLLSSTTLRTKITGEIGDPYATKTGIPQGDALSSILFVVYLESIMRRYAPQDVEEDIILQYADDTKFLFHERALQTEHGPVRST